MITLTATFGAVTRNAKILSRALITAARYFSILTILHDFFFKPEAHAWYFFGICITPPPPPHQKSNGPPLTENAWSCVIEIWIRGFGVLKERLSEGLRFVVWPRLNYKTKTSSVSRLLASDKAFERGSSFCSLTRPKLQNEDPVGFACDSVP